MQNPTKVLQQAILLRDVRVTVPGTGQVQLYFPGKDGKMVARTLDPKETWNVLGEFTIDQVKRSPSLEPAVRAGLLTVATPVKK